MPIVVMKFGGTSVGSVERICRGRRSRGARPRGGQRRDRRRERDGRHDRRAPGDGRARITEVPDPARARHAAHGGRAHLDVAARDRPERARVPRRQLHGLAGRDHHRHAARRREDHRDPAQAHPRGARRRQRRDPRGVPGALERLRDHDARSGRLRSHGGRDGRARSAPRSARSTPTSTACSPPTRGSSRARGRST